MADDALREQVARMLYEVNFEEGDAPWDTLPESNHDIWAGLIRMADAVLAWGEAVREACAAEADLAQKSRTDHAIRAMPLPPPQVPAAAERAEE